MLLLTRFNTVPSWWIRYWFFLGLATVLTVGFFFHGTLDSLTKIVALRNGTVATVMFLMAWSMDSSAVWRAFTHPSAGLCAVLINLGLLPLLAWGASRFLADDLAVGILIAATAPCTLASASVWTRRAGGNDAIAVMVTLITNLSCFLVTPCWLYLMAGRIIKINLSPSEMIVRLFGLVVLPICVGQMLRLYGPVREWVADHKPQLNVASQSGILTMVLIGAIQSGRQLSETGGEFSPSGLDYGLMVVLTLGCHCVALAIGFRIGRQLNFRREDTIAVAISGSQKTMTVGIDVAITYFGGLTILPMVTYHVGQLIIDTFVSDRLKTTSCNPQHDVLD